MEGMERHADRLVEDARDLGLLPEGIVFEEVSPGRWVVLRHVARPGMVLDRTKDYISYPCSDLHCSCCSPRFWASSTKVFAARVAAWCLLRQCHERGWWPELDRIASLRGQEAEEAVIIGEDVFVSQVEATLAAVDAVLLSLGFMRPGYLKVQLELGWHDFVAQIADTIGLPRLPLAVQQHLWEVANRAESRQNIAKRSAAHMAINEILEASRAITAKNKKVRGQGLEDAVLKAFVSKVPRRPVRLGTQAPEQANRQLAEEAELNKYRQIFLDIMESVNAPSWTRKQPSSTCLVRLGSQQLEDEH